MKRARKSFVLLFISVLLLTGCGVQKKNALSRDGSISALWIKKYDLTTCSEEKMLGKLGIRYIRDSVMLIILRNRSGMEGARIYIYKDSVFIYNRTKKTVYAEGIPEYIRSKEKKIEKKDETGLLRKNVQKKYFEFYLGNGNKVSCYVDKYVAVGNGYYIPGEMKIKTLYNGQGFCYRLVDPAWVMNTSINVRRINDDSRFRKVKTLDEVL